MPRRPRDQRPGFFHVTTRGNNGRDVFLVPDDRRIFLLLLNRIAKRLEWKLHAWCLMTNHFHMVIETRHENLSHGMQRLNGVYAQWFNAAHGRRDHLFGRRFWSKRIEDEEQLETAAAYILHNPVKAGLCASPWDWRWIGGPLLDRSGSALPSHTQVSASAMSGAWHRTMTGGGVGTRVR